MANAFLDTSLVDRAIKFAVDAHSDSERRGKGFPYVIHVLEAMEIVATMTVDQELLAAAALHDTVEDTDVTLEDIEREFGHRVASLVSSESDVVIPGAESDTWRARKQAAIDRLAAVSKDAKMVALGDKLSNMRAITRDYMEIGDRLWDRFHAPGGKADHEWHYRGLASSLVELSDTSAYREFVLSIDKVFGVRSPEPVALSDYIESGGGYMGVSYSSLDGRTMLKLYRESVPAEAAVDEYMCFLKVSDLGIRTPAALRPVSVGNRYGVEYEIIPRKRSFARAISDNPGDLEKYALEFAAQALRLHSKPCDILSFSPCKKRFLDGIDRSPHFTVEEKEKMRAFVKSVPDTRTCIHGDMHIGNIITNEERLWWIDIGDFGYGNPLFDLGMFYFTSKCCPDELIEHLYHISGEQMRRVWTVFCHGYFGSDYTTQEEIDARLAPFAALYMVCFSSGDKVLKPAFKEHIYKTLLK